MTALEAKKAADKFNLDLYNRTLEKVTEYINKRVEEAAYRGNYSFISRAIDEDLAIALEKRELRELFKDSDLQEELKRQFKEKGFCVKIENVYNIGTAFMQVSWREPC